MQVDVDERGRSMSDHKSQHHERDRRGDVPALQAGGHETPQDEAGRNDGKGRGAHVVVHR